MKIEDVKKNLNKAVTYKDNSNTYILTGCIIRKNDKGYYYQAEILDTVHGKSLIICSLDDVTERNNM